MSEAAVAAAGITALAPLLAALVPAVGRARFSLGRTRAFALTGCGLSLAASVALLVMLAASGRTEPLSEELYSWLHIPGVLSFDVTLSVQVDGLSALLVLTSAFVTTMLLLQAGAAGHDNNADARFFRRALFLQFASIATLLVGNFFALFFFWQLAGIGAYLLIGTRHESPVHAVAARRTFLTGALGDVAFLTGIYFIWVSFGTAGFPAVLDDPANLAGVLEENPHAPATICLCLFVGVMARCAQFPLFGWLNDVSSTRPAVNALLQSSTTMLIGAYVMIRCLPLLDVAPNARSFLACIGGLTACLTAIIALTQNDLRQVLGYATAGQFGWIFLGIGSGTRTGLYAAVLFLLAHTAGKAALFAAATDIRRRGGTLALFELGGLRKRLPACYWSFAIAAVVLTCGWWGQNAVLDELWQPAGPEPAEPNPVSMAADRPMRAASAEFQPATLSASGQLSSLLLGLGGAHLLLMPFALFRAFFLIFHHADTAEGGETDRDGDASARSADIVLAVLTATAVITASLCAGPTDVLPPLLFPGEPAPGPPLPSFVTGFGSLLFLLGVVGAWMIYLRPSDLPGRLAGLLGPFTRLSRRRFYLDEVFFLGLLLPVRGIARFCRFLDRSVIDSLVMGSVPRLSGLLARAARPLQTEFIQFYALSSMLAAAVLLAVLLWLNG